MKSVKGFTIVEVLVVIGIIAVLTVIVFPAINNIRAKNRDAERVADISAIQLGLSMYYSQNQSTYPASLDRSLLVPKYVPADSLVGPSGENYAYVPLAKNSSSGKCTYYHLGAVLELPSGQIDTADTFTTENLSGSNAEGYRYCGGYAGPGITPPNLPGHIYNYNVHP